MRRSTAPSAAAGRGSSSEPRARAARPPTAPRVSSASRARPPRLRRAPALATGGDRRVSRLRHPASCSSFVLLLGAALAGCSSLPPLPERTATAAMTDTAGTDARRAGRRQPGAGRARRIGLPAAADRRLRPRCAAGAGATGRALARRPVLPPAPTTASACSSCASCATPPSAACASACWSTTSTPAARTSCSAASPRSPTSRCACSTRCRRAAARSLGRIVCFAARVQPHQPAGCTTSCSSPTTASRSPAAATWPTSTSCAATRPTSSTWT